MQITVDIPDAIAQHWGPLQDELSKLLALGLIEVNANPTMRFSGLAEVLAFFAKQPASEEIFGLRLSETAQAQVEDLLLDLQVFRQRILFTRWNKGFSSWLKWIDQRGIRIPDSDFEKLEHRVLDRNRDGGLNPAEQQVWQQYEFVEHLVRMAKAEALLKLQAAA